MRVRAKNPAQPLAGVLDQQFGVRGDLRARIDQRQIAFIAIGVADDVSVGARAGHHAGIGRGEALHARVDANEFAGDDGGGHDRNAPKYS